MVARRHSELQAQGSDPEVAVDRTHSRERFAVQLENVSKVYRTRQGDVHALQDVSFSTLDQQFIAIVGPSGCGKTTILKMLAGLVAATSGRLEVFGRGITGPIEDVGIVFQAPVLLRWKDVVGNVLFPIDILHRDKRQYKDRAQELLHLVGLEGFERRHPSELSGGMQQRVALARALVHDPRLLLMDEPFGALDQLTRHQMNLELLRIWTETHKTTVLITHDIEEAVFLADKVVVMTPRPGKVAAVVSVDLPRPRDFAVRRSDVFAGLVVDIGKLIGLDVGA
jgi:NitT/TauT family transport system ATP-binding protein